METDKFLHPVPREGFVRSAYPDAIARRLFKYMNVKPGDRVLEIAAGTGKWTEKLMAAGFDVTAVEPSTEMTSALRARLPGVKVMEAMAEALPFGREAFDHVFVASAFHRFQAEVAYREILRVLKPSGGVGLLWTAWDPATVPEWYREVRALVAPFELGGPRYLQMQWRVPFDAGNEFKMLQFECHDMSRPIRSSEICERLLSISYVSSLPDLIFNALKKQIENVLERHILKGQIFKLPEEAHIYWTHKTC